MKLVAQRVKEATVTVDGEIRGAIGPGILVLLGVHKEDTQDKVDWFVNKLLNLRIFEDENGKMNLSVKDIGGNVLIVSQFTLYANSSRGRRPDFIEAAPPEIAEPIYERFVEKVGVTLGKVQSGMFGAHMDVSLVNDGPVTIILEEKKS